MALCRDGRAGSRPASAICRRRLQTSRRSVRRRSLATSFPNRTVILTAAALGLRPTRRQTSLDAVSDRDFAIEFLGAGGDLPACISRVSPRRFVIWSSNEFGFITLSDAFTTGSSIMPQKTQPGMRAETRPRQRRGRLNGSLVALADGDEGPAARFMERICREGQGPRLRSRRRAPSSALLR